MSHSLGPRLPDEVREWLDAPMTAEDEAVIVATVDEVGLPRFCQLGRWELCVVDEHTVRLATWPQSSTTGNLRRSGALAVLVVVHGRSYSIRMRGEPGPELDLGSGRRLSSFTGEVVEVLVDEVPYAEVTSGVSFQLETPEQTLPMWRRIRELLRDA